MIPDDDVLPQTSYNLCMIILITLKFAINDQFQPIKEQKGLLMCLHIKKEVC